MSEPLLGCKLGDRLRQRNHICIVIGINTLNGDLYVEDEDRRFETITSKTIHNWERMEQDA